MGRVLNIDCRDKNAKEEEKWKVESKKIKSRNNRGPKVRDAGFIYSIELDIFLISNLKTQYY